VRVLRPTDAESAGGLAGHLAGDGLPAPPRPRFGSTGRWHADAGPRSRLAAFVHARGLAAQLRGPLLMGAPVPLAENKGERGIALIAVLWILALLATLVLGFVAMARTDLRIVANDTRLARARGIADAGVTLAILAAFDQQAATKWSADGQVHTL